MNKMEIKVHSFTFNAFQENTYILSDIFNNCVIVDPGCYDRAEQNLLVNFIESNKLKPLALLNTHAHIDHVLGNAFVLQQYAIDFYLHPSDFVALKSVENYAHVYGFEGYRPSPEPTKELSGGQTLRFGEIELEVLFTPGHSPGHVVFYNRSNTFVVNGDVLFNGSFGRVDLPGGDIDTLKKSIFETMFALPDETKVYCGHGPETTIGQEKKFNYIHNF
jgi:glyoxylase-like metal-dependent hydrolase (beta-lactamase superfamily II)